MSILVKIATDFCRTPGARYRSQSKFSGEQFREECLDPKFKLAVSTADKLNIDLDGTAGYMTSFLEEAFGGLARVYGAAQVLQHLGEIVTDEEPYLKDDI